MILLVSVNAGSQSLPVVFLGEPMVIDEPLVIYKPSKSDVSEIKEQNQIELQFDTIIKLQYELQKELRNQMFMAEMPNQNKEL